MTAPVRRRRRARPAACTAAQCSAPLRTGGAAAEMPLTRPCTASASGPACGARRACSTTACRTRRESSGSRAPAMTPWGAIRTPCAAPAGWPCWPCRSSYPACAATCLCAPACAVERGAAAAGVSTRRSDEARLGDKRDSLGPVRNQRGWLQRCRVLAGERSWKRCFETIRCSDVWPSKVPKSLPLHSTFFSFPTFQFGAFLTGPCLLKVHCESDQVLFFFLESSEPP